MNFDQSFQRLPSLLFEHVTPTPITEAKLVHVSALKQHLEIDLSDEDLLRWLNGEKNIPGEQRIATRYAGHQFGVWAGQLGDGRAISLGEIINSRGERWEIQTKGSGMTPFSRHADGKAVIRSSVREYLASEAMHGLGIPTTRVLALMTGEDHVYREQVEKSAVVARVFPSNLRFGHFEYCYHFDRKTELQVLSEYMRTEFFSSMPLEEMLEEIVRRTASLMAQWMGVGFCHGVMNTDNMSALGLTIDYGPYGFMEDTQLGYICNHSDHAGRYSYQNQPNVAHWNLSRFLVCFMDQLPQVKLQEILNSYPAIFDQHLIDIGRKKLGLFLAEKEDGVLFADLLKTMSDLNLDFTWLFRQLCDYEPGISESFKEVWDYYGQREELKTWLLRYDARLKNETASQLARSYAMKLVNPYLVLKNYIAQEVIEAVEGGDNLLLNKWLSALYQPYQEHPELEQYSRPTPPDKKSFEVSCSS